jgi:hypothetical protein
MFSCPCCEKPEIEEVGLWCDDSALTRAIAPAGGDGAAMDFCITNKSSSNRYAGPALPNPEEFVEEVVVPFIDIKGIRG